MRLIDADALLEMVDKERQYLIARGQNGAEHILVHNFRDLINNAPSVPLPDFKEGYKQAIIDGKTNFAPCYQTTSCLDCKMYDKENHHCPRFCEVIRELVTEAEE